MLKNIFFKQEDPKELVRKWQADLRSQTRAIDRQIRDIQFEEKKVQKSIKDAAKRGDMGSAKHLAKEIARSRQAITRLYTNKAQLMSVGNSLTEQLAMIKVAGAMSKSTAVMKEVASLMKVPEIQRNMVEISKEMMKAGLIEEMMNEALDSALDTEDVEEETEEQIQKVLSEIIGETSAALPQAQKNKIPPRAKQQELQEEEEEEEEGSEMAEMRRRLDAIRS
ncbi:hypothetical protein CEUSTIGMA_g3049.t1 [Chlamydomonas eustigma]|uniref:Uncharacterized protein n=1 Tax=Chlamydomonas eustigma TaxID=1157962 RepID=A0A250WXU6_9CHLO|nr:hypothetical protein CEUSTIGMA_g3049.t1 [Chlamydomonas eustigma]|eukprot:GAX75605.1 hypothetical protein CEUSTIGMA_g3049.t1 [Chlamydomonas eustigma]